MAESTTPEEKPVELDVASTGKYRRILAALPERTGRTLELGCSAGVFTEMLAPRCESLLAVDFSPTALERAGRRLADVENVELSQRLLPEQTPAGPFETIVCVEIFHCWSAPLVLDGLERLERALAPGGTLLAVHSRGGGPRRELDGNDVHRILRERARLRRGVGVETPDYLLDRWKSPSGGPDG